MREEVIALHRGMRRIGQLRAPGLHPRWSGWTDDSTPFDYSVVFGKNSARLRFTMEAQADPASPAAYWRSGQRCTRWLGSECGANIAPALLIEDLFEPTVPVYIGIVHSAEFYPGRKPVFKVYFNSMARGGEQSVARIGEALTRLGLNGGAWEAIKRALRPGDRLEWLSLDLSDLSRTKVYVRPLASTMEHLQDLYAVGKDSRPEDLADLWTLLRGQRRPDQCRPIFITYQLVNPKARKPQQSVMSLPLFPGARNDAVIHRKFRQLFARMEIPPEAYDRCVKALSERPLAEEEGIHAYVSVLRDAGEPAVKVYFNPRVNFRRYGWISRNPGQTWPSAVPQPAKPMKKARPALLVA